MPSQNLQRVSNMSLMGPWILHNWFMPLIYLRTDLFSPWFRPNSSVEQSNAKTKSPLLFSVPECNFCIFNTLKRHGLATSLGLTWTAKRRLPQLVQLLWPHRVPHRRHFHYNLWCELAVLGVCQTDFCITFFLKTLMLLLRKYYYK